jgi:3-hydroxyisobutyrate dehydrogenase-like beta-hydroxyacid dehydrogenase
MKVAFIGLGNMGYPMAAHVADAGHEVMVFNRTRSIAERWVSEHRGERAETPGGAAQGADVVCTCVGADSDVRDVVYGDSGALAALAPGAVLIDHTTASAGLARELGQATAARGIGFIDAPVSGGQAGAQSGKLSIMCGADPATLDAVRPVLETYGGFITRIGPIGHGQLTKMVNQILCAAAIEGAAEALNFALTAGLAVGPVMDAVTKGAANSWYLENRGHTMVEGKFDFGFAVDWMRKDLGICLDQATQMGAPMPFTTRAESDYAILQERGEGRLDATAVIRLRQAETAADAAASEQQNRLH